MKFNRTLAAALTGLTALTPLAAIAQDKVTLKFGHTLPENHYIAENLMKPMAKAIEERTGGSVAFEIYPAAQLGKDMPTLLQSGVLDLAHITVSLYPEKFALTSVAELPGQATSACSGTKATAALLEDGQILDQLDFQPNGIQAVATGVLPPYPFTGKGKRVNTVADFQGVKTWVNGPAMERTVAALGGVPIKVASTELYEAASRGTLDAMMFPLAGTFQYDLNTVIEYIIDDIYLGAGIFVIGMSDASLAKLSDEQKQIVLEESIKVQDAFCDWADKNAAELRTKLDAQDGFEVIQFSDADLALFKEKTDAVASQWVDAMKAAGKPGDEILAAFEAGLQN